MRIITLTLAIVLATSPALAMGEGHSHGDADHSKMEGMDHSTTDDGEMDHSKMDHSKMDGIHTTATVHSIDGDTVNVTHPPIPDLRWPAMTMDLMLLEGAEVGDVEAGDEAMLMLEKGEDGMVGIRAMMPAK